jgi:hypothetical protein
VRKVAGSALKMNLGAARRAPVPHKAVAPIRHIRAPDFAANAFSVCSTPGGIETGNTVEVEGHGTCGSRCSTPGGIETGNTC